eukprot:GILJ01013028.1.p1 GENE.GILJ01013028.1~~GILJ01013028.1.p1  ORF type:complete len:2069 (-),score=376.91 GILJ01013028.1:287-6298(-)
MVQNRTSTSRLKALYAVHGLAIMFPNSSKLPDTSDIKKVERGLLYSPQGLHGMDELLRSLVVRLPASMLSTVLSHVLLRLHGRSNDEIKLSIALLFIGRILELRPELMTEQQQTSCLWAMVSQLNQFTHAPTPGISISLRNHNSICLISAIGKAAVAIASKPFQMVSSIVTGLLSLKNKTDEESTAIQTALVSIFQQLSVRTRSGTEPSPVLSAIFDLVSMGGDEDSIDLLALVIPTFCRFYFIGTHAKGDRFIVSPVPPELRGFIVDLLPLTVSTDPLGAAYGAFLCLHAVISCCPDIVLQLPVIIPHIAAGFASSHPRITSVCAMLLNQIAVIDKDEILKNLVTGWNMQHKLDVGQGEKEKFISLPFASFNNATEKTSDSMPLSFLPSYRVSESVYGILKYLVVTKSQSTPSIQDLIQLFMNALSISTSHNRDVTYLSLSLLTLWFSRVSTVDHQFGSAIVSALYSANIDFQSAVLVSMAHFHQDALNGFPLPLHTALREYSGRVIESISVETHSDPRLECLLLSLLFCLSKLPHLHLPDDQQRSLLFSFKVTLLRASTPCRTLCYKALSGSSGWWRSRELKDEATALLWLGLGDTHPESVKQCTQAFLVENTPWTLPASTKNCLSRNRNLLESEKIYSNLSVWDELAETMVEHSANWRPLHILSTSPFADIFVDSVLRLGLTSTEQQQNKLTSSFSTPTATSTTVENSGATATAAGSSMTRPADSRMFRETSYFLSSSSSFASLTFWPHWVILCLCKTNTDVRTSTPLPIPTVALLDAFFTSEKASVRRFTSCVIRRCLFGVNGNVNWKRIDELFEHVLHFSSGQSQEKYALRRNESILHLLIQLVPMKLRQLNTVILTRLFPSALEMLDKEVGGTDIKKHILLLAEVLFLIRPRGMSKYLSPIRDWTRKMFASNDHELIQILMRLYPLLYRVASLNKISLNTSTEFFEYLHNDIDCLKTVGPKDRVVSDPLLSRLSPQQIKFVHIASLMALGNMSDSSLTGRILDDLLPFLQHSDTTLRRTALQAVLQQSSILQDPVMSAVTKAIALPLIADPFKTVRLIWQQYYKGIPSSLDYRLSVLTTEASDPPPPFPPLTWEDASHQPNQQVELRWIRYDDIQDMPHIQCHPKEKEGLKEDSEVLELDQNLVQKISSVYSEFVGPDHIKSRRDQVIYHVNEFMRHRKLQGSAAIVMSEVIKTAPSKVSGPIISNLLMALQQDVTDRLLPRSLVMGASLALHNIAKTNVELVVTPLFEMLSGVAWVTNGHIMTLQQVLDVLAHPSSASSVNQAKDLISPEQAHSVIEKMLKTIQTGRLDPSPRIIEVLGRLAKRLSVDVFPQVVANLLDLLDGEVNVDLHRSCQLQLTYLFKSLPQNHPLFTKLFNEMQVHMSSDDASKRQRALTLLALFISDMDTQSSIRYLIPFVADPDTIVKEQALKWLSSGDLNQFSKAVHVAVARTLTEEQQEDKSPLGGRSPVTALRKMSTMDRSSFRGSMDVHSTSSELTGQDRVTGTAEQDEWLVPMVDQDPLNKWTRRSHPFTYYANRYGLTVDGLTFEAEREKEKERERERRRGGAGESSQNGSKQLIPVELIQRWSQGDLTPLLTQLLQVDSIASANLLQQLCADLTSDLLSLRTSQNSLSLFEHRLAVLVNVLRASPSLSPSNLQGLLLQTYQTIEHCSTRAKALRSMLYPELEDYVRAPQSSSTNGTISSEINRAGVGGSAAVFVLPSTLIHIDPSVFFSEISQNDAFDDSNEVIYQNPNLTAATASGRVVTDMGLTQENDAGEYVKIHSRELWQMTNVAVTALKGLGNIYRSCSVSAPTSILTEGFDWLFNLLKVESHRGLREEASSILIDIATSQHSREPIGVRVKESIKQIREELLKDLTGKAVSEPNPTESMYRRRQDLMRVLAGCIECIPLDDGKQVLQSLIGQLDNLDGVLRRTSIDLLQNLGLSTSKETKAIMSDVTTTSKLNQSIQVKLNDPLYIDKDKLKKLMAWTYYGSKSSS